MNATLIIRSHGPRVIIPAITRALAPVAVAVRGPPGSVILGSGGTHDWEIRRVTGTPAEYT